MVMNNTPTVQLSDTSFADLQEQFRTERDLSDRQTIIEQMNQLSEGGHLTDHESKALERCQDIFQRQVRATGQMTEDTTITDGVDPKHLDQVRGALINVERAVMEGLRGVTASNDTPSSNAGLENNRPRNQGPELS